MQQLCYCYNVFSVCLSSSVTLVDCDKTAAAGIMQFSLKSSEVPELFAVKSDEEISPMYTLQQGHQTREGWL